MCYIEAKFIFMSMEKIIESFGEFVLDEQIYFYEQREVNGLVKSRKLSPVYALENWEIYVLPMTDGFLYAIIGLHGGKRFFYADGSKVSSSLKYFVSAGQDLICRNLGYREVYLLHPQDGVLKNITYSLKERTLLYTYVSSLEYVGGVLAVSLQTPRFSCEKRYFLQNEEGYKVIRCDEAMKIMKNASILPLHNSFN